MKQAQVQDAILLLLAADRLGRRSDLLRLQKVFFLYRHSLETASPGTGVAFFGRFLRQQYGPCSGEVYDGQRALVAWRLLDAMGPSRKPTSAGVRIARRIEEQVSAPTLQVLDTHARQLARLDFDAIRQLIYPVRVWTPTGLVAVGDMQRNDVIYDYPDRWQPLMTSELLTEFLGVAYSHQPSAAIRTVDWIEELDPV